MKAQKTRSHSANFAFLQLEVLTNLANETNIPTVLREFQVRARGQLPARGAQESCPADPCAQ